jgi:phosphatidylethanolamine-binding protein (PEBP) family uncharacterized protein
MRANLGLLTPAVAALCLAFAATGSNAADIFSLTSTTFEDGKLMPKKVANSKANQPNNPNCVGDNVSPQFSWSNPPDGTKSFMLMMFDPEWRAPSGVSHWVAYGIPSSVTGFAEAETSKPTNSYVGGKTRWASASIPDRARRRTQRRITIRSSSPPRTSSPTNCRPG